MPGIARVTADNPPPLGTELFWRGAAPPAPSAPYAVVVSGPQGSTAGQVWQGVGVNPFALNAGEISNQQSIGLVIKFNEFTFLTAGDLPTQGEDALAAALLNQPLSNGVQGGTLPGPIPLPRMAAFKCGHHGAETCTSDTMLAELEPVSAVISCGFKNDHPKPETLQRLEDAQRLDAVAGVNVPTLRAVILTNCRYARTQVAAAPTTDGAAPPPAGSVNQWMPNSRMWIAGDNAVNNLQAGRQRGDIHIRVFEHRSSGPNRAYRTTFYDNYAGIGAGGRVTTFYSPW
jgi:hypothetical protein